MEVSMQTNLNRNCLTKNEKAIFSALLITGLLSLVFYLPEVSAAPTDKVDELDGIFVWLKKIIAWGFYLIGSGAGLNFGYQLAAIQNFKSAGISATAAALCLGLGAKLSATAII